MTHRILPLLTLTLVIAACSETVTQPEMADTDLLTTALGPAGNGGNGNGVQFFTGTARGIRQGDDDGQVCVVENFYTGEDDASDWRREDKDGVFYYHLQDAVASIYIWDSWADYYNLPLLPHYWGEGRWTLNWYPDQLGMGADVSQAHGTVSDGTDSFNARCSVVRNNKGRMNRDITVR